MVCGYRKSKYTNVMRSTCEHRKSSLTLNCSFILPLLSLKIFSGLLLILLSTKSSARLYIQPHLSFYNNLKVVTFLTIPYSIYKLVETPQQLLPFSSLAAVKLPKSFKLHLKFHLLLGYSAFALLFQLITAHSVLIELVSTIIPCGDSTWQPPCPEESTK